jgi:hypothetical protein
MLKHATFLFAVISTGFVYSQYCTAVGPTTTIDSNVKSVVLNGASGSINFIGCPGVVGLQDLTILSTTLNAGGNYTASIEFGTCGNNYNGVGEAWIDYDQSGTFDASESIGTWQGIPPAPVQAFNFTVPFGAQNGATRMRVMQYEGGTLPLNPCATFSWGSVTDFTIVITNGVDCSGYVGDDLSDPIVVSALPYIDTNDNSYCYGNQNLVYNSPDVYYQVNPSPMMQSISVSLCGSGFDTFLSVVDANGNVIAYNDDAPGCGTTSALTFNTAGYGIVYVIVEGWGISSGDYTIEMNANYLSTEELNLDAISIYPNPAMDHFVIDGYEGIVEVIDNAGRVVLSLDDYTEGQHIDVSGLNDGLYVIQLTTGQQQRSKKLLIGL